MNWWESSTCVNVNVLISSILVVLIWSSTTTISNIIHSHTRWCLLQHSVINHQVKGTSTQRCHLSQHHILWYTLTIIQFGSSCCIQQNLNGLFERTTHQRTCIGSVNTMTSNCHQMTTGSHNIDQQCHMTVVDVWTIERNDIQNFFVQRRSRSFNTQNRQHLNKIIRVSTCRIHTRHGHNICQINTIGF